jgi:hypothetical protein
VTLTVACVYRPSAVFTRDYVERLRSAVSRHMSQDHIFVCLTNKPEYAYDMPLLHDWPGYWSKVEMFRPGLFDGPVVYLDLDTVIIGPIDWMAPPCPQTFAMYWHARGIWSSAFMAWWGDHSALYEGFAAEPEMWRRQYGHWPMKGDQAFLSEYARMSGVEIQDLAAWGPQLSVQVWPKRKEVTEFPETTSLLYFKARRKPHLFTDHPIVRGHWR